MGANQPLTRAHCVKQVLAQHDGPVSLDEFCQQVLTIWPSKAKNPLVSMRSYLRHEEAGRTLVFQDAKTILPMPVAMRGVRFRLALSRSEAKRGALTIGPAFDYFLRQGFDESEVQLFDPDGRPLPVRLGTVRTQIDTVFGPQVLQQSAFDLGGWFRAQRVRRGDHILVTIKDWSVGCFALEHEPSRRRRKTEIQKQDRELADLLFGMLEAARGEQIYSLVAIPTAYARLTDPHGYPGSHWSQVISRDERMAYNGWAIRYSDWQAPLELMVSGRKPQRKASFSASQGQRVYRVKAALWQQPGLWRRVEVLGEQTLADLDTVMRIAFEHDPGDHWRAFANSSSAARASGSGKSISVTSTPGAKGMAQTCRSPAWDWSLVMDSSISMISATGSSTGLRWKTLLSRRQGSPTPALLLKTARDTRIA